MWSIHHPGFAYIGSCPTATPPTSPTADLVTPPDIPFPEPPVPSTWKQTEERSDANTSGGQQFYKRVQPTAWSRNRQLAGLPTFQLFPWLLAFHGPSDYTARSLSNNKYTSLVPTRSIAESVFLTHLIQQIREQNTDLDATADALHRSEGRTPPSKTTDARAFMQPLMDVTLATTRHHAPAPADRQLHSKEAELQRATEKLQAHGLQLSPQNTTASKALQRQRPPPHWPHASGSRSILAPGPTV